MIFNTQFNKLVKCRLVDKALDEVGVDWLHTIVNEFLRDERIPGDLKESEIVTIYKQKGDALECGNYRGIKLLEIALKVYERVIERRIRERVHIHSNQFGFMPGRGTIDPIFILRQVQEKILGGIENDTGHLWIWRKLLTSAQRGVILESETKRN